MRFESDHHRGWRDYQKRPQRGVRKKSVLRRLPLLALYSGGCFLFLVFCGYVWFSGHPIQAGHRPSDAKKQSEDFPKTPSKHDLSIVPKDLNLNPDSLRDRFVIRRSGARFTIVTTLDPALQNYIINLLQRSRSLWSAVVVLNPNDGRVLAMASYKNGKNKENLCLKADFPAASLFKVISAAAAIESAGFTPDRAVFFQGRKHTLYKKQLLNKTGKYSSKTSFRKAFSSSINSVFGKLGIYDLGQDVLAEYANRFLFNQTIPFDLPVAMSTIHVPEDSFGLAEIASGFNKRTLISPLHAVLLASAVANNGIIEAPRLVNSVSTESGEILYESKPTTLASPVSRGTSEYLKVLMRDTVFFGTCRKSFMKLRRKKAFRSVDLGAKTGTINDKTGKLKYDWLTAYALPKDGVKAICIAVLSVHGKKIGVRANDLGQHIINYYLSS